MKKCKICQQVKDLKQFYKHKQTKDGVNTYCKTCQSKINAEYRKNNKERIRKTTEEWRANNRERMLNKMKEYGAKNRQKLRDYAKTYAKNNKAKRSHWNAKRKAIKRSSIPSFVKHCDLESKRLKAIYTLCINISKTTGVEHHVDHMWPLADGGPHWSGNLQIIPAEENIKKRAKVDPAIKATIQEMLAEEVRLHAEH